METPGFSSFLGPKMTVKSPGATPSLLSQQAPICLYHSDLLQALKGIYFDWPRLGHTPTPEPITVATGLECAD